MPPLLLHPRFGGIRSLAVQARFRAAVALEVDLRIGAVFLGLQKRCRHPLRRARSTSFDALLFDPLQIFGGCSACPPRTIGALERDLLPLPTLNSFEGLTLGTFAVFVCAHPPKLILMITATKPNRNPIFSPLLPTREAARHLPYHFAFLSILTRRGDKALAQIEGVRG